MNQVIFIALSICLSANSWGQSSCRDTFTFNSPSLQIDPITTNFAKAQSQQATVNVAHTIAGQHGGQRVVLTRTGQEWISHYATYYFDIQGDPRWFIGAVGTEMARFFGFEIIDNRSMTIPDPEEFNGAVEIINNNLIEMGYEPIPLTFVSDHLNDSPLIGYLNHFTNSTLPLSPSGNHLVHDMSFHSGVIFTPPALLEVARNRTQFVLDFYKHLVRNSTESEKNMLASIRPYIKELLVRGIDNGTAYGNIFLIAEQTDNAAVKSQISTLLSSMNDIPNTQARDIAFLPTGYLSLGSLGFNEYYANQDIIYFLPDVLPNRPLTLAEFTLNMFRQFLSQQESLASQPEILEDGLLSDELLTLDRNMRIAMESFAQTAEGKLHELNLISAFSPLRRYAVDEDHSLITDSVSVERMRIEFLDRFEQIRIAAHRAMR